MEFLENALATFQQHIGHKDLTRRMMLSVAIIFLQQLIDNLTLKVEWKNVDLDSFYPASATKDQVKQIFREIKLALGV